MVPLHMGRGFSNCCIHAAVAEWNTCAWTVPPFMTSVEILVSIATSCGMHFSLLI